VVELGLHAALLEEAQVHALEHLGPVLGIDTTLTRVN